ncbi:putative mitochondrial distribution and morphology protein 31, mitochondrial precursor [Podospora australis]|uniref:Mitochondrial distribution and morphology protein 31, mitochondrial n=1 Tax=Podospora australis TaxID=1536484 RepID=A0AAN7AJL4_9PEZI|nr:putative mitochondrial distribution and morphology protein 31, mitochondrial precursor [Podospora australis]
MTSSAATTPLGRHFWGSIRDTITARVPQRQQPLLIIRSPLGQPFLQRPKSTTSFSSRAAFLGRSYSRASSSSRGSPNNARQSCTSGGLLLFGLSTSPIPANTVIATRTAAVADSALAGNGIQKAKLSHLARQIWLRSLQLQNGRDRQYIPVRRASSSTTKGDHKKEKLSAAGKKSEVKTPTEKHSPEKTTNPGIPEHESLADSMSKYLHLPKMPHRPTKEELLEAANGFLERLRVRFKWFSIRSMRPWNADEWGAFVSWFLFGHLVWIFVGTTTFFSLIILFINTVFAQETLAKWIGDYLTQSAGLTVVFESAIVPKWKDGVITFRNVFVSRRPGQHGKSTVKKGSSQSAAEAAAARQAALEEEEEADDGNYTQFDVTIDTVNVTLSFLKWWNGKGLLKDVEVKGVRGVIDRTSVQWSNEEVDPLTFRHEHNPGDFELDYFRMEDLLVTVHQPDGFRPFSVSIFACELPQLRKQWLFYDFLSASHMSGAFDGSLFTIHPRQIHGVAAAEDRGDDEFGAPSAWKKFSRLRIDGLKIDHLNRGVEGPFGWIYEGNVDVVADVMFPADPAEGIGKVVAEFYDKMEEAVTSNRYLRILDSNPYRYQERADRDVIFNTHPEATHHGDEHLSSGEIPSRPYHHSNTPVHREEVPSYLVMDLRIHLNNVRAAVPLFNNPHISYVNQALVRPIVAYINAKRTYIPVNCRIVKRVTDFDGSWTVWDCGLMDDTSAEVYTAFAANVEDQQSTVRRFKRVGLWTVSLVVHALLAGVVGDLM